jgi:glycosyltransferase involved in cell wall biosynthesis
MATVNSKLLASVPTESWIALLGRRDTSADGVEDYCTFLARALGRRGVPLKKVHLEWKDHGWLRALWELRRASAEWRGKWVLLQHTALGWSQRGFPIGALVTLVILKCRGVRCAVVFHEACGLVGARWIDIVRGVCQNWIVRTLYSRADISIFTAPIHTIAWLSTDATKAAFIPIGANIPEPAARQVTADDRNGAVKKVAIFCLSGPPNLHKELDDISRAVQAAATEGTSLQVVFLGRGTAEAKKDIENIFARLPVEVTNLGLQDAEEISRILVESDVMLCVRGELFPGRGSAIAGIACGLPILGFGDETKIAPLSEAGVYLVPYGNGEALGDALRRLLGDSQFQERLRARSRRAQKEYFSWDAIAEKFHLALQGTGTAK